MTRLGLAGAALLGLVTAACGSDDGTTELTLSLQMQNLPNLGADYVYEGWLIDADGPVSSGRFTVDDSGALSPATFAVDSELADAATLFVLTIEPATGDDPAPTDTHVAAGPIANGAATLSTSHEAALGTDFATAAGTFILATPTTADNADDNSQGIWFVIPGETPAPSLELPTLPAGWVYEGWIVDSDGPISTGRFSSPSAADSDAGGADAGPDDAPPFPGQDFVDPALDLVGLTAVISVEPDPDNGAAPFIIKPLVDADITLVAPPADQEMANQAAATLPAGSISIQ